MHTPGVDKPVAEGARIVRIGPDLLPAAARRLVPQRSSDVSAAARRFIDSAASHGIDLSLVWGALGEPGGGQGGEAVVRQAVLAVPGTGRTVAFFVSEPPAGGDSDRAEAARERSSLLEHACAWLAANMAGRVCLAQMLPEPRDAWAPPALEGAGFRCVGSLKYMRRPARLLDGERGAADPEWPDGVRVERFDRIGGGRDAEGDLVRALDRSYIGTLDCPELCGLRPTRDILESHRSTGVWDPALWWVAYLDDQPEGCLLMARCPETASSELVYLGLSPALRGKGVGPRLLALGVRALCTPTPQGSPGVELVCAVDRRNTPALRLYERAGFRGYAERVAYVRPL
ncbi:MAG: GNAT family N-acetyltransferase [Phycisphaerae bacterium]|nr:GNAT family N-acetyltransferase [Phycisphaerae bacterium]